jgi:hypothetical protein
MTDCDGLPLDGWMVAWTPIDWRRLERVAPPGAIEIGPWPDETGWSDKYAMTVGCCLVERHRLDKAQKIALMFIDFHTCVVRDGIDPLAAHRQFLKIADYRRRISPDIPGAAEQSERGQTIYDL